jgi:hypothetical protein
MSKTVLVHDLVYDEEQIMRFARLIKSDAGIHQIFLNARKKYSVDKSPHKNKHMNPKVFSNTKPEQFLNIVKSYERPIGSYRDSNEVFPTDILVLYATTNPRSGVAAAKKFVGEIMDAAFSDIKEEYIFSHLHDRLNSCIMGSKGDIELITIDIDGKELYPKVAEFLKEIDEQPAAVIETHGGYHVLLNKSEKTSLLFKEFSSIHTMGDIFCPIPGTYQGGFPVRFVG